MSRSENLADRPDRSLYPRATQRHMDKSYSQIVNYICGEDKYRNLNFQSILTD